MSQQPSMQLSWKLQLFCSSCQVQALLVAPKSSPAMMNDLKGAMADAKAGLTDAATDAAKKVIEEELAEKAPDSLKPLFPCCGGPVGTMDRCICMVQEDQREQATRQMLPNLPLAMI